MSYSQLLTQLSHTRQASGELLDLLREAERRIEPGFYRIESLLPDSEPIDGSSERMRRAATMLYVLYTFREYLSKVKQEMERVDSALQQSLETVYAAALLVDLDCVVTLQSSPVFEKISELSQTAEEMIGHLIRQPAFTTAVTDYECLLETAELLIQEELIQSRMRLGGEYRIVRTDPELEACVRDGSLLSVWKDGDSVYEFGLPQGFTSESVRIDDIHFSRRNLTFAVRLLSDIH